MKRFKFIKSPAKWLKNYVILIVLFLIISTVSHVVLVNVSNHEIDQANTRSVMLIKTLYDMARLGNVAHCKALFFQIY